MLPTRIAGLAAAFTLLVASSWSVPTAHSQGLNAATWVATPNGVVGTQQAIAVRAPRSAGKTVTVTFTNAAAGTNAGQVVVNTQGFAYLPWTPNLPGTWEIDATVSGRNVGSSTITVDARPTTTTLLAPNAVRSGRPTSLLVFVKATGGQITPSGTITVRDQSNDVVATGTLGPTDEPGTATASVEWVPVAGPVRLVASYSPSSSAFAESTSLAQTPVVGGTQAVALRLPPVSYVGVPETVAAVIQPSFQSPLGGSVAFNVNIDGFTFYPMGGSQPIGSGVGSTTWTPTQPGTQTIGVSYASANFAINGTDFQAINVLPTPTPDTITVGPDGLAPWTPGTTATGGVGTSWLIKADSLSGNPVTLSTDGPCVVNGAELTLLGPGSCRVTASSLGNGGSLTATTSVYPITVPSLPGKRS